MIPTDKLLPCRDAFEEWIKGEGFTAHRNNDGNYGFPDTAKAWKTWQAAYNATTLLPDAEALVEKLEAEIVRLEKLVYVPGLWKCAKCNCNVVSNYLHAKTGNVAANNDPQSCPNDCGPMWRVTEREAVNDLIDRMEALHAEQAAKVPVADQGVERRIRELEVFIEQMYATLKAGKIRDFDTNWRMGEMIMPPTLECIHARDAAEISGSYRKIHLSEILSAARELINLHWTRTPKPESNEAAMGEAQGQTLSGAVTKNSMCAPSPASVLDEAAGADAVGEMSMHSKVKDIIAGYKWGENLHETTLAIMKLFPTSQPAPVSLEKCARACAKASGFDSKASAKYYINPAKAVLDAAGVAYVD